MMHDDDTPVYVPLPEFQIEQLKIQILELRKEHELWRPIVETAKVVCQRWQENAGDYSDDVGKAIDILFSMVNAAESARRDSNG